MPIQEKHDALEAKVKQLEARIAELEARLDRVASMAAHGDQAWSQLQPLGGGLANGIMK